MNAKHNKTQYFVRTGLFSQISTFKDLEKLIANLPQHERGDAFEVFAESYLATQVLCQAATVWPFDQIPMSIRSELGLSNRDMGVDGILKTHQGDYHAYQVKYRANRAKISWDKLSTFMGLSDRVKMRILFTNCDDLPDVMNARTDFYAIKGNDLGRLEESDFRAIEEWMQKGKALQKKKTPFRHQKAALDDINLAFNTIKRTTAVMACGTGKTLISLWVAEQLDARTILVLLPSLALLRQTLHDWAKETRWENFNFLCVCSDPTVVKNVDDIKLYQRRDLNFAITTEKEIIERFLKDQKSTRKIVFSTYQSSKTVAEASPKGFIFELGIFDEAHKTAGREGTNFSHALKDSNLPVAKRLFLTATPRHYDIDKKDKEGNLRLVFSMDDQEIYGEVSHKLSFAEAVKQGIICNYKIIISVVTSEEIDRKLLQHGEVVVEGYPIKAPHVANALALTNAVEKYGVKHIFTFHSSVKAAKSFTSNSSSGISAYIKDINSFHVNGEMPTSQREMILKEFEQSTKSIISNARCLTEGVNVPAVDMVAFMSPKKSQIDIVQAAGRAMRKKEGKEFGYILVPLFLEMSKGENVHDALEATKYEAIWDVLQTLQEQDESLVEIIQQAREEIGKTGGFNESRLRERIELIGPEIHLAVLRKSITSMIVDKLSSTWDEKFGELVPFKEQYGHCNVPRDYEENKSLAHWVNRQRDQYRNHKLQREKIERLNGLGFDWNPNKTFWHTMFTALKEYKKANGNCNVPQKYALNLDLGTWVSNQRSQYKKGKLFIEQVDKLNELGFDWIPHNTVWEKMFLALEEYKLTRGHCNVRTNDPQYSTLGTWVERQRSLRRKSKLPQNYFQRLNGLGFNWEPLEVLEINWQIRLSDLSKFKKMYGHCNVTRGYSNKQLAIWVNEERDSYRQGGLSDVQIRELNKLGFVWHPLEMKNIEWANKLSELAEFKWTYGHCNVPRNYQKNKQLANWVNKQRDKCRRGKLSSEYVEKLNGLSFDWNPDETHCENMFDALTLFKKTTGHCNVPRKYTKNPALGIWVASQRSLYKKGKLTEQRIMTFNKLGFVWKTKMVDKRPWNEMFDALRKFKEKNGHCNVPQKYEKDQALGTWISAQRMYKKKGRLSQEQIDQLNLIGFDWNPLEIQNIEWNDKFSQLIKFKEAHGHCNVPNKYASNPSLGTWVDAQRVKYRKQKLSTERVDGLNKLGFVWSFKKNDSRINK